MSRSEREYKGWSLSPHRDHDYLIIEEGKGQIEGERIRLWAYLRDDVIFGSGYTPIEAARSYAINLRDLADRIDAFAKNEEAGNAK